jgi:hypothetical protein
MEILELTKTTNTVLVTYYSQLYVTPVDYINQGLCLSLSSNLKSNLCLSLSSNLKPNVQPLVHMSKPCR